MNLRANLWRYCWEKSEKVLLVSTSYCAEFVYFGDAFIFVFFGTFSAKKFGRYSYRQRITSKRTLLNFLWYILPYLPLQSSQFNRIQSFFLLWFLLFFRKVHLFGDQISTHSLMLPYLPHMFCSRFYFLVTLNCVFCTVHAYSRQVLSFWLLWLESLPPLQRFEFVRRQPTNQSIR